MNTILLLLKITVSKGTLQPGARSSKIFDEASLSSVVTLPVQMGLVQWVWRLWLIVYYVFIHLSFGFLNHKTYAYSNDTQSGNKYSYV